MGQNEVFEHLIRLRYTGDDDFKTAVEIHKSVDCANLNNTRMSINRLYAYGYLEVEKEGLWLRKYRVKEKYCKDVGLIKSLMLITDNKEDLKQNGECISND